MRVETYRLNQRTDHLRVNADTYQRRAHERPRSADSHCFKTFVSQRTRHKICKVGVVFKRRRAPCERITLKISRNYKKTEYFSFACGFEGRVITFKFLSDIDQLGRID